MSQLKLSVGATESETNKELTEAVEQRLTIRRRELEEERKQQQALEDVKAEFESSDEEPEEPVE